MKATELKEDRFGVPTPSEEEVAKKHGVSLAAIKRELELGMDVELEHTDDEDMAREIALDHLDELPDYYTRLRKMEGQKSQPKTDLLTIRDLEAIIEHSADKLGITVYELLSRLQRRFGNEE